MDIQYKLFKNKKGLIIGRAPKRFKSDVTFCFLGAGDNLTVILKDSSGNRVYRQIVDEKCVIPFAFLKGNVSVVVADLKNSMTVRYKCESLICHTDADGVWIMPEEMDLPIEIIEAQNQIEELSCELKKALDDIANLKEAYQGYDVI